MKRFFTIMIAAILIVFGAGAGAQATVLTFDELDLSGVVPGTGGLHLDNYAGFIWENVAVVHPPIGLNDPNGYKNGVVSLDNVAYNGFGAPATIISLTSFDFNGVYLTGSWNNRLNIDVTGYLDGSFVASRTVIVDSYFPTWFDFNLMDIDELVFNSYGGVSAGYWHNGSIATGTHFNMDNFTFNEAAPVPEPSTMILLGAGLVGLVVFRKKFRKS